MELTALPPRLARVFLEEARQRLAEMHDGLAALRGGDEAATDCLWRAAHTIKGNAAMVCLDELSELAGSIEHLGKTHTFRAVHADADRVAMMVDAVRERIDAMEPAETGASET